MSDTVQVTVALPKPPEGYEYTGEFRQPRAGDWTFDLNDVDAYRWARVAPNLEAEFILRPILPATVQVTLTREIVEAHAQHLTLTTKQFLEEVNACRAALAASAAVCGIPIMSHFGGGPSYRCQLPPGHSGEHTPEKPVPLDKAVFIED